MKLPPCALVILDGYGYRDQIEYNAVAQAHTPHLHALWKNYPHALLHASGVAVGLPEGCVGNSEVGHLTIGAGHTITQSLTRINEAIADKSLLANPILVTALNKLMNNHGNLHIMGLLSDAGVHSTIDHLDAYIQAASGYPIPHIYLHLFLDGRDVSPQSANIYLEHVDRIIAPYPNVSIGSLHGRWYAMDRNNNWDRTERTYDVITEPGTVELTWQQVVEDNYRQNITDEYIPPTLLNPDAYVRSNDGIIFFNYRPDRARQLTQAYIDPKFHHFKRTYLPLSCFITPVSYAIFLPTDVLFSQPPAYNTLKDDLAAAGKRIFAIAESEKYAHVTYFFTGQREEPVHEEKRVIIPSLPSTNYIDHPCMSAPDITRTVLESLRDDPYDFYLINYANADMVGHSGDFKATIKALECLDAQLKKLYDTLVVALHGTMIITADHGKAEEMFNPQTQQPRTGHTTHPVPFIVISTTPLAQPLNLQELKDIKPFILEYLGIIPK
jgi:2,3-bisphosphoglycerate-independent phosphoglycerate mutase